VLVGDAAGFADPLVGEGIFYAMRSAELAAESILLSSSDHGVKERYLRCIGADILPELAYAGKISNAISRYFSRLGYLPLKLIMNMLGTMPIETIHGMRSYRWMRQRP
jgi:flavin-dependent dehydrogenase